MDSGCPDEWSGNANNCYKYYGTKLTYDDARLQCRKDGGRLAEPRNPEENKFIFSLVPKCSSFDCSHSWIGINDQENEGSFTYDDGSALEYTDWRSNEPTKNRENDEDCVHQGSNKEPEWNDRKCDVEYGFICEMKMQTKLTVVDSICTHEISPAHLEETVEICKHPNETCKHKLYKLSDGSHILCDHHTNGGGYFIVQRRFVDTPQFRDADFNDYVNGFGDRSESFFVGLEYIHRLCPGVNKKCELRIELILNGREVSADYKNVSVSGGSDSYKLHAEFVSGTRDVLDNSNGRPFTTESNTNCVPHDLGGWWFDKDCLALALNGKMDTFSYTEMKIRQDN